MLTSVQITHRVVGSPKPTEFTLEGCFGGAPFSVDFDSRLYAVSREPETWGAGALADWPDLNAAVRRALEVFVPVLDKLVDPIMKSVPGWFREHVLGAGGAGFQLMTMDVKLYVDPVKKTILSKIELWEPSSEEQHYELVFDLEGKRLYAVGGQANRLPGRFADILTDLTTAFLVAIDAFEGD